MHVVGFMMLLLLWNQGVASGVRIVQLRVAAHMAEGSDALLGCTFDLGDELLYSLKWYKDGKEFFRYVPKATPTMKSFYVPGVTVDLNRSTANVVALKRVTRESAGEYQCEVKAEAPTFTMVSQEKTVSIDLLPKWGPQIIGLQKTYHVGSQVTLNCTTTPSRPEAQLTWLVNGRPAARSDLRGPFLLYDTNSMSNETFQAKLMLNFTVKASNFDQQGAMSLKCQATIPPLYHQEKQYTFYEPLLQTTTEAVIEKNHVANVDIPSMVLVIHVLLLLLVN